VQSVPTSAKKQSRAPLEEARPAVTHRFEERYADGPLGIAGKGEDKSLPEVFSEVVASSVFFDSVSFLAEPIALPPRSGS
jgi:hypothetical protein